MTLQRENSGPYGSLFLMADFKAVQRILSKFPVFKALSNTLNQDNIDQILPDLDSDSYVESALFYIALMLVWSFIRAALPVHRVYAGIQPTLC